MRTSDIYSQSLSMREMLVLPPRSLLWLIGCTEIPMTIESFCTLVIEFAITEFNSNLCCQLSPRPLIAMDLQHVLCGAAATAVDCPSGWVDVAVEDFSSLVTGVTENEFNRLLLDSFIDQYFSYCAIAFGKDCLAYPPYFKNGTRVAVPAFKRQVMADYLVAHNT